MMVIPYSGFDKNNVLTVDQKRIYDEIYRDSHMADINMMMGNGLETLKYAMNGQAEDWILKVAGVISIMPEIGSRDMASMTFDIFRVIIEAEMLIDILPLPMHLLEKAAPALRVSTISAEVHMDPNEPN